MTRALRKVADVLGSYALACVLLVLLLGVTFVGTLAQVELGVYEAQRRFFLSYVTVLPLFGVLPAPFPGAALLLAALGVNTLFGMWTRGRRAWQAVGIWIVHLGVLALLGAGMAGKALRTDGYVALEEGESATAYESYQNWELVAWRTGSDPATEFVLPLNRILHAGPGRPVRIADGRVPFTIAVGAAYPNVRPAAATADRAPGSPVVQGFYLAELPRAPEAEANLPGAYLAVNSDRGEAEGLVFGAQQAPWTFEAAGEVWAVDLRKVRRPLPFAVTLRGFEHRYHPGTRIPAFFESAVSVTFEGASHDARIRMNEPLREQGYTLYQASWGPQDGPPDAPLYSVLAVVHDPTEWMPLAATTLLCGGMTLHFAILLAGFLWQKGSSP